MAARVTFEFEAAIDQPLRPLPTNKAELERCLRDPHWRLFSGCLYRIMIKGEDEVGPDGEIIPAESFEMPFTPNKAQRRFISRLWHRNVILKARQLGFTTLIAILWLDHALFNKNQRCGIIAQGNEQVESIFKDKVKFAYDNLPEVLRERFPLVTDSKRELHFAHNNSIVRVGTSMRSGTFHRLHISEFGKICADSPKKAVEVITGSIPTVPLSGILVIESTAEGDSGEFYNICITAMRKALERARLTARDYRFHFYAWWQDPGYRMDSTLVEVSEEQHEYFDVIEREEGTRLDPDQRAWYVATMSADFEGNEELMWREYPSSPMEAFKVSLKGTFIAKDVALMEKRGGVREIPLLDLPVHTFWDIGRSDGCAIWFLQVSHEEVRVIDYEEEHDKDLREYASILQNKPYVYGHHFLPHDADHKRLSKMNQSTKDMLMDLLPGHSFHIVQRIELLMTGVYQLKKHMKAMYFNNTKAVAKGIKRLRGYRRKYNTTEKRFTDEPDKSNGCTEGADALRQYAQAKESGLFDSVINSMISNYDDYDEPDWRL